MINNTPDLSPYTHTPHTTPQMRALVRLGVLSEGEGGVEPELLANRCAYALLRVCVCLCVWGKRGLCCFFEREEGSANFVVSHT